MWPRVTVTQGCWLWRHDGDGGPAPVDVGYGTGHVARDPGHRRGTARDRRPVPVSDAPPPLADRPHAVVPGRARGPRRDGAELDRRLRPRVVLAAHDRTPAVDHGGAGAGHSRPADPSAGHRPVGATG